MSRITDSAGQSIGYMAFDLDSGETSATVQVKVYPDAGDFLKSSTDTDVQLQARRASLGGAWTNLAGTGLDMTGIPQGELYDVRAVAGAYSGEETRRFVMFLGLTKKRPAGWAA